jgi:hypothetical protein
MMAAQNTTFRFACQKSQGQPLKKRWRIPGQGILKEREDLCADIRQDGLLVIIEQVQRR